MRLIERSAWMAGSRAWADHFSPGKRPSARKSGRERDRRLSDFPMVLRADIAGESLLS